MPENLKQNVLLICILAQLQTGNIEKNCKKRLNLVKYPVWKAFFCFLSFNEFIRKMVIEQSSSNVRAKCNSARNGFNFFQHVLLAMLVSYIK